MCSDLRVLSPDLQNIPRALLHHGGQLDCGGEGTQHQIMALIIKSKSNSIKIKLFLECFFLYGLATPWRWGAPGPDPAGDYQLEHRYHHVHLLHLQGRKQSAPGRDAPLKLKLILRVAELLGCQTDWRGHPSQPSPTKNVGAKTVSLPAVGWL